MAESKEEPKTLLMKVKKDSKKASLKLNTKNEDHGIQSHHFMANRWGKKWKQWQTLFSWAPKSLQMVTVARKLRRYEHPRQHIEKQKHYFANKVHLIKAMVFAVVMYECESQNRKKAECQMNQCF